MTSRRDRKFPHEPGGDAPRPPSSELAAPSDAGQAPALRAPLETIAHAMKTQADLLRQMHERQRALEDAVRDERRHELTINSAQALNDSFRGLQQTQERLAERLAETQRPSKARAAWIAALVVAVLGAGAAGAWALRRGADDLGDMVKSLEKPRVDEDARAALKALEARVGGVEATDRAAFQGELDRLRRAVEGAQAERETLRRERDQAREETGVLRGRLADAERDGGEARAKLEALEKENARLSTQSVADRRLLTQLNEVVEALKGRGAPAAAAASTPPPPTRSEEDAETERLMAAARAAAGLPPAEAEAPTSAPSGGDAAPAEPRDQPFTEARREAFNRLLAGVRSSSKYAVVSASGVRDRKLRDAVVEVRGADGSLDKTIEARELSVRLSPRGEMCDLDFEGGSVSYHQTVGGRGAKSPFFNNRYQIVLLGVSAKDWLAAGFPFVAMK